MNHDHTTRRINHYKQRGERHGTIGFIIGLAIGMLIMWVFMAPAVEARSSKTLPPAWQTWLEICSREQPKPGRFDVTKWSTPNWTNTANYSFPGGCGLTIQNYDDIKMKHWPDTMDKATPAQQLWACHRLFWKYARIGQKMLGSYEAGQRYGATVWDVHYDMGWHGFERDGVTWQ